MGGSAGRAQQAQEVDDMAMMATDYPFLSIFWTMMIFVFWVIWIWLVITVLVDVFRRKDLSGWGKAGWTVFVIVLPFLGVLIYLIAHGTGMSEEAEAK
jgi:Phospholipase_D-nuclease N-terminal